MANDDFSQPRRRPGANPGLNVVRMSDLAPSPPPAAAAAPLAAPLRPAMRVAPRVLTSSTKPAVAPPPPMTSVEGPAAPRQASGITGGIPRHIGSLDGEVEPSLPRPRPAPPATQAQAADVSAALAALGVADARPPPAAPPTTASMQGVATRARQVLGVAVLAGAAAVATSTFRDGAAAWTADDRRTLVDTWLRSNAWGRVRSDDVVGAVGVVGATVVPASVKSAVRFVVVDGPVARAEAMPDGTVVVTTAALRALSTDAELAAVLAHALAHHAQGHRTALLDGSEHARSAQRALHSSNPHEAAAIVDEVLAIVDPVDESAIASATQQLLEAGGWRPHALAEAVAKLQAQRGWHTALTPSLAHTLEQMPRTGRASASQYTREVLDRVGHQR